MFFIYKYLDLLSQNSEEASSILETIPMDRDETIKAFNSFKNKLDKTIY